MVSVPPSVVRGVIEHEVRVAEVFGPTFQGEGPLLGMRVGFVRFGDCNLTCSWCDTPYTWDWRGQNGPAFDRGKETSTMTCREIAAQIQAMKVHGVVVTGGEPLIQSAALQDLCDLLPGIDVQVETNGTIAPTAGLMSKVAQWNVSPKLANSGVRQSKRFKPKALQAFVRTRRAAFKFVCQQPSDLDEVAEYAHAVPLPGSRIWIMPEGRHEGEVLAHQKALAGAVLERGWNLTTRLHVLTWGAKRGV